MHHPLLPVFVLVFSSVLWGLSWLPLKGLNQMGVEGVPLLLISNIILVSIFLFPLLKNFQSLKNSLRALLTISFFGGSAILCFTYALMYGDIIRVMVLFYLLPVWGVLGGMLFLGEKPDGVRWLGVFFAIVGAFLILGGVEIFKQAPNWIDILALLSGLFFAANNLCFRGVENVPLSVKLWFMFAGCAALSGLILILGIQSFPASESSSAWFWLALYSLTWLLLANLGSQWAVTQMEAGRSSIIIIVELVAAVLSALLIAGERLSAIEWLGCAFVIIAALIEALRDMNFSVPILSSEKAEENL